MDGLGRFDEVLRDHVEHALACVVQIPQCVLCILNATACETHHEERRVVINHVGEGERGDMAGRP